MSKFILSIVMIAASLTSIEAMAFNSPISVGVFPPVEFPQSDTSVTGLRLSGILGRHRDLYGLDFALGANITDQDFAGLALAGVANITNGTTKVIGLQAAGIANVNTKVTNVVGFQIAALLNNNIGASTVN